MQGRGVAAALSERARDSRCHAPTRTPALAHMRIRVAVVEVWEGSGMQRLARVLSASPGSTHEPAAALTTKWPRRAAGAGSEAGPQGWRPATACISGATFATGPACRAPALRCEGTSGSGAAALAEDAAPLACAARRLANELSDIVDGWFCRDSGAASGVWARTAAGGRAGELHAARPARAGRPRARSNGAFVRSRRQSPLPWHCALPLPAHPGFCLRGPGQAAEGAAAPAARRSSIKAACGAHRDRGGDAAVGACSGRRQAAAVWCVPPRGRVRCPGRRVAAFAGQCGACVPAVGVSSRE